jgi:hypothetical protein
MWKNYLARSAQAQACRFGVYAVNPDGTKRQTCPISRHVTRANAERTLANGKGVPGFAVLPLPGVTE